MGYRVEFGDWDRGDVFSKKTKTRQHAFALAKKVLAKRGWRHPHECAQVFARSASHERRIAWVCKSGTRLVQRKKRRH